MTDFIFLGSKTTADIDCSHEIKRYLIFGRKTMTNLGSILKSSDITLPTKVHLVKVKVAQSCLTLCDPMDYRVHGILQARTLERGAFPFSRQSSQPRDQTQISWIPGRCFNLWATGEAPEGSLKKERSFQTPGNTLTAKSMASLGITQGNITGRKNK